MPEFNELVMERLVEMDRYLTFVFNDLSNRNRQASKQEILEVLYNSNVIDDSLMESLYEDQIIKTAIRTGEENDKNP